MPPFVINRRAFPPEPINLSPLKWVLGIMSSLVTVPGRSGVQHQFRLVGPPSQVGKVMVNKGHIRSRRALTLIELLAVIAIIGILAAILIPVTSRMRDSAKVAACQSNLRELGTAVYLFAADHDDHTPPNINPEVDPPELADLSGTFVGGPDGDVRTLGWLIPEEYGGPPESPNRYIDNPAVLFCPSLSSKVYAASDEYKRPEEIGPQNPIRRTGYAWIYRIPRKEDHHNYGDGFFAKNPNHKVTVENKNVPLAFDFGWTKGYGHQGPIISIPSHHNVMNVLHLGGHITTITHDEANKHDGYDALYRFIAGYPKP